MKKDTIKEKYKKFTGRTDDDHIVLNEGKIVEKGKHEGLLESQNLYKNMWEPHTSARKWSFNLSEGAR